MNSGWICGAKMETRLCNHCGERKPIEEFNWRWKHLNKRQSTCRTCQNEQKRNWYKRNKKTHIPNMVENRVKKQSAGREYVWSYLTTHPCLDCGEKDPIVLEFDHVKGKKRASISRLLRNGHSVEVIQEEINKCEVVCANCHRRRTYKNSWRDRE